MNPDYTILYPYVLALLASLSLVILTRLGVRDAGRRVFPDKTLGSASEDAAVLLSAEGRASARYRLGSAIVVETDLALPPQTELTNDLVVKGTLTLGAGARLQGNAKATGIVTLAPRAMVVGNLVSDSGISVGPYAEVVGLLHARGDVWLMPSSNVSLSIVSGGSVYIHEGAKIGKRILADRGIVCQTSESRPQVSAQSPVSHPARLPNYLQSSQAVCDRCGSTLLTVDAFRQQWRCLNCGSYQWRAGVFSPRSWNPRRT